MMPLEMLIVKVEDRERQLRQSSGLCDSGVSLDSSVLYELDMRIQNSEKKSSLYSSDVD